MASNDLSELTLEFGNFEPASALSDHELARLPVFLPPVITEILKEHGRAIFRKGALQVCHPNDLQGVLSVVFGADPDFRQSNCVVYAFSAFGSLYFWMEGYGYGVVDLLAGTVFHPDFVARNKDDPYSINAALIPFWLSDEALGLPDHDGRGLFARAVGTLGSLELGECYGFLPALALGGTASIDHLKRVHAAEHFSIIAQTVNFNLVNVEGYGKTELIRKIG